MLGRTTAHQYLDPDLPAGERRARITVTASDCLITANSLVASGTDSVCLLNFANQHCVGGDYLSSKGQEESLVQRSDLLDRLLTLDGIVNGNDLNPHFYRLPGCLGISNPHQQTGFGELTCLFTPSVTVHTTDQRLDNPFRISIISSAAYNLADEVHSPNRAQYYIGTVLKIINQLRVAKKYGQRNLILGAFGCGAFENTPEVIAEIYHAALFQYEFLGCFDNVFFAIKPTYSSQNNTTYDAFVREFSQPYPRCFIADILSENMRNLEIPADSALQTILPAFFSNQFAGELHYRVNLLIKSELSRLNHSPQLQHLSNFLQRLLRHVNCKPNLTTNALAVSLWSTECPKAGANSSIFRESDYPIIRRLQQLTTDDVAEKPALQQTEIYTLALSFIKKDIITKAQQFIDCCQADDDKTIACYLLYVAVSKDQLDLARALDGRFTEEVYQPLRRFLHELNKLSLGISNHEIIGQISDPSNCKNHDYRQWQTTIVTQFSSLITQAILTYLDKSEFNCNYDRFEDTLSKARLTQ